jgi:hypothetical protein
LLNDVTQGSWSTQAEIGPWFQRLLQQRSSMAQINPMTLKRLVGGQARSVENLLSQVSTPTPEYRFACKNFMTLVELNCD